MTFDATPLNKIPLPVLNNVELSAIAYERLRTLADAAMISMATLAGIYLSDKIESECEAIRVMAEEQRIEQTPWITFSGDPLEVLATLDASTLTDPTLHARR